MRKLWKRGDDRELEAQLRARRPEPRPEVTRAIADRVRPARSSGVRDGLSRVPLGLAGGLTAMVLAVVIALGGGSYPLDAAREVLNVHNTSNHDSRPPPTQNQYGRRVVVCLADGRTQVVVPEEEAARLVRDEGATLGPCPRRPR